MNLKRIELEKCVDEAFAALQQNVRKDGNEIGWHQHLGSPKIGNVATAQSLLVSDYLGKPITDKDAAFNTLISRQKISIGDAKIDGGWTFVTNVNAQPTTEATAWSVLALSTDLVNKSTAVNAGAKWLLANKIADNGREVWGSTCNDEARVYTTSLAIRALCACHLKGSTLSATEWLLAHQNGDGGWGSSIGGRSTMVHTAHVIIALKEAGSLNAHRAIQKATDWLLSICSKELHWNTTDSQELMEEVELVGASTGGTGGGRITFYHFSAPWVISALIKAGRAMEPKVIRAIKGLIDSAEHGYWYHPHHKGGGKKTSWAIHDCLFALSSFEKAIPSFQSVEEFVDKGTKFDIIVSGSKQSIWKPIWSFCKFSKWWIFAVMALVTIVMCALGYMKTESGVGAVFVQFLVPISVILFDRLK